jgi:D-glycero-alpha-D-manno-heptose-7-phosphate kinase
LHDALSSLNSYFLKLNIMSLEIVHVRARAPLRLGLGGGGTDVSPYSEEFGGAVLNCTIDRYAYAFLTTRQDNRLVLRAKDVGEEESFEDPSQIHYSKLDLHRGVYQRIIRDFNGGKHIPLTITTLVDAPRGSGLGSSSALVVALVSAFRELLNLPLGQYDVAHLAFEIERQDLGLSGGKQDQYAAAFGGANFIEFFSDDRVIVNPLRVHDWVWSELESSLVAAFSGQSRHSGEIIERQKSAMRSHNAKAIDALHALKQDAVDMKNLLLRGDIVGMGEILNHSWESKKATASGITNPHIDYLFGVAKSKGAYAGKVSGAGGGGFAMFLVRPENRIDVVEALNQAGAVASPVKFTEKGCESWVTKG